MEHAFGSLLLLVDNYIQQLRTKPQRHKGRSKIRGGLQFCHPCELLAATPGSRGCRLRSGPGRRSWDGPSGVAASSSGRAGLPGKRSCPGAGSRSGLRSGEDGSRWAAFSRLNFLGNDGNWQFLLSFLIMGLKHVIYIFL